MSWTSENLSYKSGGAITVLGPAISTFLVEDSIFDMNAVRVPANGARMDITVRLNT
eukprot:COSAG04_NODE_13813_length_591_cov_1.134146_1_plen_55_part_10